MDHKEIETTVGKKYHPLVNVLLLIIVLVAFYLALKLMGSAFKGFGKDTAQEILRVTSNPFVALFLGMMATAIIQSSSTTTSMIVTMVATGSLTVSSAVPLIMGANIGTSVTSSILAFSHIGKRKEYRRAVASATVHDFFNILVVFVLLPIELIWGVLSTTADKFTHAVITIPDEVAEKSSSWVDFIKHHLLFDQPVVMLIVSLALLFFSLRYLTIILKRFVIGKVEANMDKYVFNKPIKALGWGALLTMLVQSSSVTTSLMVPMVASNKVSLKKAFPFLMGANIGTTLTALIASLLLFDGDPIRYEHGISIAIVHVLFNILGVVVFFPFPALRNIPIKIAKGLGELSYRNRLIGIGYVIVTFFLVPLTLYFFTKA